MERLMKSRLNKVSLLYLQVYNVPHRIKIYDMNSFRAKRTGQISDRRLLPADGNGKFLTEFPVISVLAFMCMWNLQFRETKTENNWLQNNISQYALVRNNIFNSFEISWESAAILTWSKMLPKLWIS